jgi:Holliday junction DNA helicase RuvA
MIGKLRGIVDEKEEDAIILDVGGVGYLVFVHSRLLASLKIGDSAQLHTEMIVREDAMQLYGFPNGVEREWFRLLTTVQRLGNKMALLVLGAYSPAQLVNAIMAKDTSAFSRISGIGAKLAERIVIELKDKVLKMPTGDSLGDFVPSNSPAKSSEKTSGKSASKIPEVSVNDEAISALVNLGYTRSDAYSAAIKAAEIAGANNSLSEIIKLSLKELGRN